MQLIRTMGRGGPRKAVCAFFLDNKMPLLLQDASKSSITCSSLFMTLVWSSIYIVSLIIFPMCLCFWLGYWCYAAECDGQIYIKNEGCMFLKNVGYLLQDYTSAQIRRPQFTYNTINYMKQCGHEIQKMFNWSDPCSSGENAQHITCISHKQIF